MSRASSQSLSDLELLLLDFLPLASQRLSVNIQNESVFYFHPWPHDLTRVVVCSSG